jgi:hypothetical protein
MTATNSTTRATETDPPVDLKLLLAIFIVISINVVAS